MTTQTMSNPRSRWLTGQFFGLFLTSVVLSCASAAPSDLTPVQMHNADAHPPLVLVDHGRGVATLCVFGPRSGRLSETIVQLQSFIEKATGAKLPIVYDKLVAPAIVIGNCELAREQGLNPDAMPPDGFAIKTTAQNVFIVGRDGKLPDGGVSEGTSYGIIDFLERFVGVRWYFPTDLGLSIPPVQTLAIEPVWLTDAPAFRKRPMWPPTSDSWHGTGTPLTPVQNFLRAGDSWPHDLVVHSPDWSHVKEYTEKRPEIFQLRSDGTRDYTMLCYGNPRTLETYLENIERHSKKQPGVHLGIRGNTIAVSPADAEIACYCPDCRRLWNEKGGQYGSASRILATFVANLGKEVEKRHPQYNVLYLPYLNYTDSVEGITFPGNVEVQLCGMPGLAQYKEPAIAAGEQLTIDGWIKSSGCKIQNWHYSCWPEDRTPAPYLFPHAIRDFYRANRDKTVGTFINGTTDHWPRQHLSLYCWLKVLWNPDFDVDAAIDEYCRRMYGPAADTMRELVRLQTDSWEQSRWPEARMSPKAIYQISFPPATVAKMEQLLAKARTQLAGHELELKRLAYYAGPFEEFFKQSKEYHSGSGFRPLIAQKVGENPKLDGKLDDAVWDRATPVEFVRGWDRKQSKPTYPTTVRAVWTVDGITFGLRMTEPTPELLERGIKGRDDSMAWWDDNVELLFDPTGHNDGDYYHFIINANNAVTDAHGKDFSQNYPEVKSAVYVGKDFWSMEVFVPYNLFPGTSKPGSGSNTVWFGNFTRHRVADQGLKPKVGKQQNSLREYQRMNTTYAAPSNNLADFAPIQFRE